MQYLNNLMLFENFLQEYLSQEQNKHIYIKMIFNSHLTRRRDLSGPRIHDFDLES